MDEWQPIETAPFDVLVDTKIDDERGERNVQPMKATCRGEGCRVMWWAGDMYVYYQPTHWRTRT